MNGPKSTGWLRRKVDAVTAEEAASDEEAAVPGQVTAFGANEDFNAQWTPWVGMPEFAQEDLRPMFRCVVNFASEADLLAFEKAIEQQISRTSVNSIWYPRLVRSTFKDKRYRSILEDDTI